CLSTDHEILRTHHPEVREYVSDRLLTTLLVDNFLDLKEVHLPSLQQICGHLVPQLNFPLIGSGTSKRKQPSFPTWRIAPVNNLVQSIFDLALCFPVIARVVILTNIDVLQELPEPLGGRLFRFKRRPPR